AADGVTGILVVVAAERCGPVELLLAAGAQLAPHLPTDPEQGEATRNQQGWPELQQPGGDQPATNPEHGRCGDATNDRLTPKIRRRTDGSHAEDDGVVAGKNEIDCDDLKEGEEAGGREYFHLTTCPVPLGIWLGSP